MARPKKQGLNSFPMDVNFFNDDRIAALRGEFGIAGEIVAIKLLCAIYRNGYYLVMDEMAKFKMLCEFSSISIEVFGRIIDRMVHWGFFDRHLYESEQVLTSREIQSRFFKVARRHVSPEEMPYRITNETDGVIAAKTPQQVMITAEEHSSRDNIAQAAGNSSALAEGLTEEMHAAPEFPQQKPQNNAECEVIETLPPSSPLDGFPRTPFLKPPIIPHQSLSLSSRARAHVDTREAESAEVEAGQNESGKTIFQKEKSCAKKEKALPAVVMADNRIPIGEVAAYLKDDQAWLEAFCMNHRIDVVSARQKIDEFVIDLAASGETDKAIHDCKRHFNNWMKYNKSRENTKFYGINGSFKTERDRMYDRRRGTEATATRPEEYEGPF